MNIAIYFVSLVSLLVIDSAWLFSMSGHYKKWLGELMASSPNFWPVVFFYPLYALALTVLVLLPALKNGASLVSVFLLGALFGLAAYGAYDLTNQATLKDWSLVMTLIDMLWGAVLSGLVGVITLTVIRYFQ